MFWIHACCRTLYCARRTRSMYHVKDYYINIDSTLTKFYVLKIQNILKLYKSRNKSLINCMKQSCRTFWRHVTKRYIIVISKSNILRHVISVGHAYVIMHTSCLRRPGMVVNILTIRSTSNVIICLAINYHLIKKI